MQFCLQLHHCDFNDVGTGTLDRCVGCGPQLLCFHAAPSGDIKVDLQRVLAQQPPQAVAVEMEWSPSAEDCFHVAAAEGKPFLQLQTTPPDATKLEDVVVRVWVRIE